MKRKMKRLAALLLALCLLAAVPLNAGAVYYYYLDPPGDVPVPASSREETIVPGELREALGEPVWYSQAVYDLWYSGASGGRFNILNGTGETAEIGSLGTMRLFRPNQAVTREQFIVMLYRLYGYYFVGDLEPGDSFFDWQPAPEDHVSGYAVQAVRWALNRGVLTGDGEGLRGTSPITRQEAAALLHRFAGDAELAEIWAEPIFIDRKDFSAWAEEDLVWAYRTGILKGTDNVTPPCDYTFVAMSPRKTVTRAEAAQMLWTYAKARGWTFYGAETWENVFSYYVLRLS